jgi:hypothetical protein
VTLSLVDEFFDASDFATAATLTVGAVVTTIYVIFDSAFALTQAGDLGVQNLAPMATCRSSDVVGVSRSSTLAIAGTTYKVREVQDDGTGVTMLILGKD